MADLALMVIIGVPAILIAMVIVAVLRDRSVNKYKKKVLEAAERDVYCRSMLKEWTDCRYAHQADMSIDEWKTDGMFYQGEIFCGPKPLC